MSYRRLLTNEMRGSLRDKGHYNDLDHALLAQIYVVQRNATDIYSDRSQKPMKLSLIGEFSSTSEGEDDIEETLAAENLEKLEKGEGTLYILVPYH